MEYKKEIKKIVSTYSELGLEFGLLSDQAEKIQSRLIEIQTILDKTKLEEKSLIDKIVKETGSAPDYYKIMLELNEV